MSSFSSSRVKMVGVIYYHFVMHCHKCRYFMLLLYIFPAQQHMNNIVTLTTEESHIKLPPWKKGYLGFHFKTHHEEAHLLYQTSNNTQSIFANKFIIKIISGKIFQSELYQRIILQKEESVWQRERERIETMTDHVF